MYLLAKLVIEKDPGGYEHAKVIIFKNRETSLSSCIDLNFLQHHDYRIIKMFTKENETYLILDKFVDA